MDKETKKALEIVIRAATDNAENLEAFEEAEKDEKEIKESVLKVNKWLKNQ